MDINYKEKIMTIDIEKETADEHNKNVAKILEVLKQDLDEERFIHTLGVAFTASSLAMRYGENIFKANYAGLLHDSAKSIPNDKKAAICDELGIEVRDVERRNPHLLHAKLGAYRAKNVFGIDDNDVLNSIISHTTAARKMSALQKIIYLADFIEPGRIDDIKQMKEVRDMAFKDLDAAVFMTLEASLEYLKQKNAEVDPLSKEVYDALKVFF